MEYVKGGITAAKGFKAAGVHSGIRKNRSKKDLALIVAEKECAAAAVYTQNKVKGAPILVTQEHLKNGRAKVFLCNSGNANTCNADGVEKANGMCDAIAAELHIDASDIIIASTGVIGQPIFVEPVKNAAATLVRNLSVEGSEAVEEAIMTTDTRKKQTAVSFEIGGKTCRVGGIAKGSGMINPNMATMLCFITTDVAIDSALLQAALLDRVKDTFNMVSVDGDTSTNDMVSVLASGAAGNKTITQQGADYDLFAEALGVVMTHLAREVARDGEGATKLIECTVSGAPDKKTAQVVAKGVISSSLVKAAMFGSDANWGRVLCAIGYAPVEVDIGRIDVAFESVAGCVKVCEKGSGVGFSEDEAASVLNRGEVKILVSLDAGDCAATAWGCDLTYDYVKINGDYRT